MNSTVINMLSGIFRAIAVMIPLLVVVGMIDQETANKITAAWPNFYESLFGSTGAVVIAMAIWSAISNRVAAVAQQAAAPGNGVMVEVLPKAPEALKTAAADPAEPNIVAAGPMVALKEKHDDGHDAVRAVGLMGSGRSRDYSHINIPYTLPNWKLKYAYSYIVPEWNNIPARTSNKIARAYNAGQDVVFDRQDFDNLPESLWLKVKDRL